MRKKVRCAVYTRKSTEEGLDQEFNSLDAQREACEAFIVSQKHEGWLALPNGYDDGGFSGGSMQRPALHRLIADIVGGQVDTVVVYKVDRLTRSLSDFAKIVEVLDEHGASFVSVTQQFNTTTSMGRLTLNVLLSFAQFEREVTGERIRDKIAASKKKGMWMGGGVPIGYDVVDRKLVINQAEAKTVRTLFELYQQFGSVPKVKAEADRLGLTTKRMDGGRANGAGGKPFSRGHLYNILNNPLYVGDVRHYTKTYPGMHEAIIDPTLWDLVQAKFEKNRRSRLSPTNARHPSLLAGLMFDARGNRYTAVHANKGGKRYRYYVERRLYIDGDKSGGRGRRLPAHDIEVLVRGALSKLFADAGQITDLVQSRADVSDNFSDAVRNANSISTDLDNADMHRQKEIVRRAMRRVVIDDQAVRIDVCITGLCALIGIEPPADPDMLHQLEIPVVFRSRGVELKMVVEGQTGTVARQPDAALIKAIVRAHDWFGRLLSGSVSGTGEIAKSEGVSRSYVSRVARLALLAPDITQAIMDGTQPVTLSSERLVNNQALPIDWAQQRVELGFPIR